ncbi:MAG: VOC family protein, partial [Deltaproteobacteria bacterium]|nr:VOC family protein [Deltaproteobacteria bacterium]
GTQSTFKPWGSYAPQGSALINMEGKELMQVGIVVKDAEEKARRYWEIFGVGPWVLIDFKPPHVSQGILHGISMTDDDFHIKAALANLGSVQFELLEPVKGASTHMEFFKKYGEGIHHVSFGEVKDHDEVVDLLVNQGIEVESSGLLGGAITFTYMSTQQDLGTIFEFVKVDPNVENTITPYGVYPPLK